jgi:hypothetical protein
MFYEISIEISAKIRVIFIIEGGIFIECAGLTLPDQQTGIGHAHIRK